jgi:hypothetical protein
MTRPAVAIRPHRGRRYASALRPAEARRHYASYAGAPSNAYPPQPPPALPHPALPCRPALPARPALAALPCRPALPARPPCRPGVTFAEGRGPLKRWICGTFPAILVGDRCARCGDCNLDTLAR